jgi:hypothetical protein
VRTPQFPQCGRESSRDTRHTAASAVCARCSTGHRLARAATRAPRKKKGLVHSVLIGEVVVCGKGRGARPAVTAGTGRRADHRSAALRSAAPRCGALIRADAVGGRFKFADCQGPRHLCSPWRCVCGSSAQRTTRHDVAGRSASLRGARPTLPCGRTGLMRSPAWVWWPARSARPSRTRACRRRRRQQQGRRREAQEPDHGQDFRRRRPLAPVSLQPQARHGAHGPFMPLGYASELVGCA